MCPHDFKPCDKLGYIRCQACGTYTSTADADPKTIYTPDYWTHARGHSTLQEQVYNVHEHKESGKSKYEFVLAKITGVETTAALEIGCAPGRLLHLLRCAGFRRVVGIETCREWEDDIRHIGLHGGELRFGFFPACADGLDGPFNLILALDLFEHVEEPISFLKTCHRLLGPKGTLLMMLPLAEDAPDRFFQADEHVWIHSLQNICDLLWENLFAITDIDKWCPGHSSIMARRM